jgi:hypothetical protein
MHQINYVGSVNQMQKEKNEYYFYNINRTYYMNLIIFKIIYEIVFINVMNL